MIYKVIVEFNSDILQIKNDIIHIGINAKPVKGQANKEIIKKLAKHFGVSFTQVIIKSGQKSKEKFIEIQKR